MLRVLIQMISLLYPNINIKWYYNNLYKIYTPPSCEHNKRLSNIIFVSFISLVISAFGWNPNIYGFVNKGNYLICSRWSSIVSNWGILYSEEPKLYDGSFVVLTE